MEAQQNTIMLHVRMRYGKYKGILLPELPADYLGFVVRKKLPQAQFAEMELKRRRAARATEN